MSNEIYTLIRVAGENVCVAPTGQRVITFAAKRIVAAGTAIEQTHARSAKECIIALGTGGRVVSAAIRRVVTLAAGMVIVADARQQNIVLAPPASKTQSLSNQPIFGTLLKNACALM
mgnify:CR=1 FL=1